MFFAIGEPSHWNTDGKLKLHSRLLDPASYMWSFKICTSHGRNLYQSRAYLKPLYANSQEKLKAMFFAIGDPSHWNSDGKLKLHSSVLEQEG